MKFLWPWSRVAVWGIGLAGFFHFAGTSLFAQSPPPSIAITNPTDGSIFIAPANVHASVSGAVSDLNWVSWFTNDGYFDTWFWPQSRDIIFTNLAPGQYKLSAVAYDFALDDGYRLTPVNIRVASQPGLT